MSPRTIVTEIAKAAEIQAPAWLSALHESLKPILHRVRKHEEELESDRCAVGKLIYEASLLPAVKIAVDTLNFPNGLDQPRKNGCPMEPIGYVARELKSRFELQEETLAQYARSYSRVQEALRDGVSIPNAAKLLRRSERSRTAVAVASAMAFSGGPVSEKPTETQGQESKSIPVEHEEPIRIARALAFGIRKALFIQNNGEWSSRLNAQQMLVFSKELATQFRALGIGFPMAASSREDGAEGS